MKHFSVRNFVRKNIYLFTQFHPSVHTTAFFYSLLIVRNYILSVSFQLYNFNNRTMGLATLVGFDIRRIIHTYLTALLLFFFLFLLFSYLFYRVLLNTPPKYRERVTRLYTILSSLGILSFVYGILSGNLFSFEIASICIIQVYILILLFFSKFFINNRSSQQIPRTSFFVHIGKIFDNEIFLLWNALFSFLIFLYMTKLSCFEATPYTTILFLYLIALFITNLIAAILVYITSQLFNISLNSSLYILIKSTCPLFLMLLAPFLSNEIYLIFNNRGYFHLTPSLINAYLYTCACLVSLYTYVRCIKEVRNLSANFSNSLNSNRYINRAKSILYLAYVPLLLIGTYVYAYYKPIAHFSQPLESGNMLVPSQQFFRFGSIPLLQNFPAHVLTDFLFGLIYFLFNGYSQNNLWEPFLYDFSPLLSHLIFYFTLIRVIPPFHALLLTIMNPTTPLLFVNYYYSIMFLAFLCGINIIRHSSFKHWTIFWSLLALLTLYRIDLGIIASLGMVGSLTIFFIIYHKRKNSLKNILLPLLIVLMTIVSIYFVFCLWKNVNPLERIIWVKHMFALEGQFTGQPHLFKRITSDFSFAYFILPFLTLGIFMLLLNLALKKKITRVGFLFALFLIISYFIAFPRALLRHGWLELNFEVIYVMAPLLFCYCAYLFVKGKRIRQFAVFLFMNILILFIFRWDMKVFVEKDHFKDTLLDSTIQGFAAYKDVSAENKKVKRVYVEMAHQYPSVLHVLDLLLERNDTFLIFNNDDVLYALADRKYPTYMLFVPLGYSNDGLQNLYLKEIKKYSVPILIFQHYPLTFWDHVDDVPNEVRAYRLAEYFYREYEPFLTVGDFFVWVRKENKEKFKELLEKDRIKDSSLAFKSDIDQFFDLQWLPFVWANYDKMEPVKTAPVQLILHASDSNALTCLENIANDFFINKELDKSTGNYLYLQIKSGTETSVSLNYSNQNQNSLEKINNGFNFYIKGDNQFHDYLVRISTQWSWMTQPIDKITLIADHNVQLRKLEIRKGD